MTDTIEIEYTTATNHRHKIVFEPDDGDWTRTEYRRIGCKWRPLGSETVSDLRVDDDRPQPFAFRGPE